MSGPTLRQLLDIAQQAIAAGRMDQCVDALQQALALAPRDAGLINALGVALHKSGRFDRAIESYRAAIELDPQSTEARFNLVLALRDADRIEDAIASLREVLRLDPNHVGAWNDLGTMLWKNDHCDEALEAYQRAASLRPDAADIQKNLGTAYLHIGRYDQARTALERAIALHPGSALAHYALAQVLLARGDFHRGWREYEWRMKVKQLEKFFDHFSQPSWDGRDLNGQRLLVHDEQGFGDAIQFVRYLPMLTQRGANEILFLCDPRLAGIFQSINPTIHLIPRGQSIPPFDIHCSLMSLPLHLDTIVETIPAAIPYLRADPQRALDWKTRIDELPGRRKIGLLWHGRAKPDPHRSIPSANLAPLADVKDVSFISLQKIEASDQSLIQPPNLALADWTEELNDFTDTAALMENLDLVISIDSAVAHLAGALGKPVWLLLPFVPDWRWLLGREDSPWYPTMKLFRQKAPGDWTPLINEIARMLAQFNAPGAS